MAGAVEFVRGMNRRAGSVILEELWPGEEIDGRDDVRRFVQDEAWGHHASCTCRMGRTDDPSAVVDSEFRVRGVWTACGSSTPRSSPAFPDSSSPLPST